MCFDYFASIHSNIGDNNPNIQNFGNKLNDSGLFFSRNEFDKFEIFSKPNFGCWYFGINKFVLLFQCETCEEDFSHQSTTHNIQHMVRFVLLWPNRNIFILQLLRFEQDRDEIFTGIRQEHLRGRIIQAIILEHCNFLILSNFSINSFHRKPRWLTPHGFALKIGQVKIPYNFR